MYWNSASETPEKSGLLGGRTHFIILLFISLCCLEVNTNVQIGLQPDVRCLSRTPFKIENKLLIYRFRDTTKFYRVQEERAPSRDQRTCSVLTANFVYICFLVFNITATRNRDTQTCSAL